jgi:hypothetical protein
LAVEMAKPPVCDSGGLKNQRMFDFERLSPFYRILVPDRIPGPCADPPKKEVVMRLITVKAVNFAVDSMLMSWQDCYNEFEGKGVNRLRLKPTVTTPFPHPSVTGSGCNAILGESDEAQKYSGRSVFGRDGTTSPGTGYLSRSRTFGE